MDNVFEKFRVVPSLSGKSNTNNTYDGWGGRQIFFSYRKIITIFCSICVITLKFWVQFYFFGKVNFDKKIHKI